MTTELARTEPTVKSLLESPQYSGRLKQILGERSAQFVTSLIQVSQQWQLQKCNPHSIIAAAMTAASLDLPIHPSLGFAWIVPYGDKASFQIGYKGLVQLANRSGQYKRLNVTAVFEGELLKYDRVRADVLIDSSQKKSDNVIGYVAYFELINGAEHALYWTTETVIAHAKRFSQAYKANKKDSPWFTDFDSMANKTVLTSLLRHWGPMSVQMQQGIILDRSAQANVDAPLEFPDDTAPEQEEPPKPEFKRGRKAKPESEVKPTEQTTPTEPPRTDAEADRIAAEQEGKKIGEAVVEKAKATQVGAQPPPSKREALIKEFGDAGVAFDDITDYLVNQGVYREAKTYPSWDDLPEEAVELIAASPNTIAKLKRTYGKRQ